MSEEAARGYRCPENVCRERGGTKCFFLLFGTETATKCAVKNSLYKTNSLGCFLAKRATPVAATSQKKHSLVECFSKITRIISKNLFQGIIL